MTRAPEIRRAALYLRVSSVELPHGAGDAELAACAHHQELALRRLVEERGWQVEEVYCDRTSTPKEGRPELERLLADARRGAFDVVVTAGLDRFARPLRGLILDFDELRRLGIDFVSLREGIDSSTPEGRIMFALIGKLAALDSALASERTRLAPACARRQGTRTGRPIGRPRRSVDCARALELRRQGYSFRQISQRMGIPVTTLHAKLREYEQRANA